MNTPIPTPRTDAATYPADCLGKTLVTNRDCSRALERELTALTAERDQLRAENATLRAAQKACEACDEPTAFEVRQLRAVFPQICAAIGNGAFCTPTVSVGFIESIPNEVQLVVAELRAEVEHFKFLHQCESESSVEAFARAYRAEAQLHALLLVCGTTDADKFTTWVDRANARADKAEAVLIDPQKLHAHCLRSLNEGQIAHLFGGKMTEIVHRAEKAEAELATEREKAERYRLATLKLDAELATERARLEWVFRNCKVTADDFTTGNRDVYAIHDREDLGAAMKEDAK